MARLVFQQSMYNGLLPQISRLRKGFNFPLDDDLRTVYHLADQMDQRFPDQLLQTRLEPYNVRFGLGILSYEVPGKDRENLARIEFAGLQYPVKDPETGRWGLFIGTPQNFGDPVYQWPTESKCLEAMEGRRREICDPDVQLKI